MAIFNSYVSLPEGRSENSADFLDLWWLFRVMFFRVLEMVWISSDSPKTPVIFVLEMMNQWMEYGIWLSKNTVFFKLKFCSFINQ